MAEESEQVELPKGGGSKKKLIFLVLGVLLLVGTSVGLTLFIVAPGDPAPDPTSEEEAAAEVQGDPVYVELDPAFTVNLDGSSGMLRVSVAVLVFDVAVEQIIAQHMPQIRNSLVLLFSSQSAAAIHGRPGKDALRASALQTIRDIVAGYVETDAVADVYFTGFVLQ